MRRYKNRSAFDEPSMVPLADMLANTVGIMVFIMIYTVLSAAGVVIIDSYTMERSTKKDRVLFVCKFNKVYALDTKQMHDKIAQEIGKWEKKDQTLWGRSLEKLHTTQSGFLVTGKSEYGGGYLTKGVSNYQPLPSEGEDMAHVKMLQSAFQKVLGNNSPKDRFVFFIVYPDSLSAFKTVQEIAKQSHFDIGWYPFASEEEIKDVIFSPDPKEQGMEIIPQS